MSGFAGFRRGRARSLATFGDSITAGSAASAPERRWANVLASRIGVTTLANKRIGRTVMQRSIMHAGVPRPGNGRDRYEADLLGPDRAVIAILCGFNDDALLSPDHVHPNDTDHAKVAEIFAGATLSKARFLK